MFSSLGLSDEGGNGISFNFELLANLRKTEFGISSIILRTLFDLGLKFKLIKLFLLEISRRFSLNFFIAFCVNSKNLSFSSFCLVLELTIIEL